MDVQIEVLGPFSLEFLTPEERGPHPVTEEAVRQHAAAFPVLGVPEPTLLIHSERALRLLNKAYNNRRVMLKNAMAEFHKATGMKAIQAKEEVWLPDGRKVQHTEFILRLAAYIEEYQPCTASTK